MRTIVNILRDIAEHGLEKIGLFYSQYRGFVLDNEDPKNMGRLIVQVPEIHGDNVHKYWAWPLNNFAGKNYGSQVLPQKNDLVWVTFEKGNTRKPLWSHGYFGTEEKPSDLTNKNLYWFRTPIGLTILLDDNNKTISLYLKDAPLQSLVLGNTLKDKLDELITILKDAKINTSIGPQGFLPNSLMELEELRNNLEGFLSENKLS